MSYIGCAPKAQKKRLNERTVKRYIFVWAALLIPVVHFCVFWVYVNIDALALAFKSVRGGVEYWTFDNFREVWNQLAAGELSLAARNTFIFFVYGVAIFPLGLFWAYFFYKNIRWKNFFRFMFYVPTIVSSVVISGLFKYMIAPDGPIGLLYGALTGAEQVPAFLMQEEYALTTVIIYGFWTGFSGNLLLLSGALARIPVEIIESANLDGIGWWREMWQICMPLIWPTLSTIIIIFSTSVFTASGEILLLTKGAGGTTTISYWMFSQIKFDNSFYLPSAFGLMLTLVAMPVSLITRKLVNKVFAGVEV